MAEITVRNLIQQYRAHNPEGHFFDRDTLKYFGESIHRMKVNGKGVIETRDGESRICYELECVQSIPEFGTRKKWYYFDEDEYKEVMPGLDDTATPWSGRELAY